MIVPNDQPIRVFIAHEDPVLSLGLAAALNRQAGIQAELAGPTGSHPEEGADVHLVDYEAALTLAMAKTADGRYPAPTRVLALTARNSEHEIREALEAGVHGYLMMGCTLAELTEGVRALAQGKRYLSAEIAQRMADSVTRQALTARESDVLRLLALGCCNKAIARDLDISVGTVKAHMKGLMGKLDASSRTQAVSIAVARGLVRQTHAPKSLSVPLSFASLKQGIPNIWHSVSAA